MFTKLKLTLATAAVLIGGVAGFAAADSGKHDRGAIKEKFDTNKDGKLDDAERAKLKAMFAAKHAENKAAMLAKFDTNKNGALDPAEKQVMHDTKISERFAKLDTNRDGKLTLDEFKAGKHHGKRHGRMGGKGHGRGRL